MTKTTQLEPDTDPMLQLKLEAPRQPPSVVDRPRLLATLNAVLGVRLLLLIAPAGFGKTTLLTQWRASMLKLGHRVPWLTLDESDADARQLLSGLVLALQSAGIDTSRIASQAERGLIEVTVDTALRGVIDVIRSYKAPLVVVLDDYHRVSSPSVDDAIVRLVNMLPEHCSLLLSARNRPDLNVPRLLASGIAAEIPSEALRFTAGESRQLLSASLPEADLAALIGHTEGWPVALQLARVVLLQGQSVSASMSRLTSRGGHLSSFLTEQVLHGLSPDIVEFLIETSILEKFNVEITDAIREKNDSWQIVEQLESLQSLITPLDADSIWFRYHHLFAEYLQALLRQRHPGRIAVLHLRASEAFERVGLLAEAVRHARDAGNYDRCASLVEAAGGWRLVLFGGMAQLSHLLGFIPVAERLSHPRVLLADAYLKLKSGKVEQARATFELGSSASVLETISWDDLNDLDRDTLNVGILIKTYQDNAIDLAFFENFKRTRRSLPDADGLTQGVLDCAGAVAALCLGRLDEAEAFARSAMSSMRSVNSLLGLNYCFLHAGLASLYRGDIRAASAYLGQSQAMAAENFGADSGLKAMSDLLLGAVHLWQSGCVQSTPNELDQAFRHVCDYDGWFDLYSAGLDTRFRLAWVSRDVEAMGAVIADGESLFRARGLDRLSSIVDAQRVLLFCATEQPSAARSVVQQLSSAYPIGCWRERPASWRPYQDVGFAVAIYLMHSDARRARAIADDLYASSSAVGAKPYAVRALLLRARSSGLLGAEEQVLADLTTAVRLAAQERITQPFQEHPELAALLGRLSRELWHSGGSPLEAAFVSEVLANLASYNASANDTSLLSAREREVMQVLALGSTNKEIARSLDMTEHTVKFHLKNIFNKMGVDRRAHALALFRDENRS